MVRTLERVALAGLAVLCVVLGGREPPPGGKASASDRLDPSGGFFHPDWATQPETVLAKTDAGVITAGTYLRYLAAREGTRRLEDLVFEDLLVRECNARKLVRNAPLIARSRATGRLRDSGRTAADDPDGDVRRKFANEALRRLRVDALVGERRVRDGAAVRGLFDLRYGVGGTRVVVRQVLVSFAATRDRLAAVRPDVTEAAVRDAARVRARGLHARVAAGTPLPDLLSESDDRVTRRMLRDPAKRAKAGIVEGYNYRRYGDAVAAAVRGLAVGGVTGPVESGVGFHVLELLERKETRFETVRAALEREVRGKAATASDVRALRKELMARYGFRKR